MEVARANHSFFQPLQASFAIITESTMLVLTRKIGEGIVIGDDVTITVVEMKGTTVRIGIDAPREKKIYRQEIFDKIVKENRDAANWNMIDLDSLSGNLTTIKGK